MKNIISFLFFISAFLMSVASYAGFVSYNGEGYISEIRLNGDGLASDKIELNDTYTFSFTANKDADPLSDYPHLYQSIMAMNFEINGYSLSSTATAAYSGFENSDSFDNIVLRVSGNNDLLIDTGNSTDSSFTVHFIFSDNTGLALDSSQWPSKDLDKIDFSSMSMLIYSQDLTNNKTILMSGVMTSITQVPLPAAFYLFGSSLLGLFASRARVSVK